jgi:methylmalonyl-CoA/ethylmalonyl-CoA epimerase
MLKRLDHVGVIVDDLEEASRFLSGMGMQHDRDLEIPGRLKAAFYSCGDAKVEVIEISEPAERAQRLGSVKARIEHIAIEVDDLTTTVQALEGLGVRTQTKDPIRVGPNINFWTVADTCDGVVYQLLQRQPAS